MITKKEFNLLFTYLLVTCLSLASIIVFSDFTPNINKAVFEKQNNENFCNLSLTFYCNDKLMNIDLSENDCVFDRNDIEFSLRSLCSENISNIRNTKGEYLFMNNAGKIGFDAKILKEMDCKDKAMMYDTNLDACRGNR